MNAGFLMLSVGGEFPIDVPSEGLAICVLPGFGILYVVQDRQQTALATAVMSDRIEVGMVDAPPFGWFVLNGGPGGWCETCWTLGLVPEPLRTETVAFLEAIRDSNGCPGGALPTCTILVVHPDTQRITAIRPLGLRASSWEKMASVLLSHRRNLPVDRYDYWRRRWEPRLDSMRDFAKQGFVFLEDFGG